MSQEQDFDADLAQRLDERLASYAPVGRIARSPIRRSSRTRVVAIAVAATIAAGAVGLGYEINASAESQGLGCLHPAAKVQLFATGHADGHVSQPHDSRANHEACH